MEESVTHLEDDLQIKSCAHFGSGKKQKATQRMDLLTGSRYYHIASESLHRSPASALVNTIAFSNDLDEKS